MLGIISKNTIQKAIHNAKHGNYRLRNVGNYKQKYNLESNSQPLNNLSGFFIVGNYKQKYNLESNSQPVGLSNVDNTSWEL